MPIYSSYYGSLCIGFFSPGNIYHALPHTHLPERDITLSESSQYSFKRLHTPVIRNWIEPRHLGSLWESNCRVPNKEYANWNTGNNKQLGPPAPDVTPTSRASQWRIWGRRALEFKLTIPQRQFRSDNLATEFSVGVLWKTSATTHTHKKKNTPPSCDQGKHYASYQCVHFSWKEVYPKTCQAVGGSTLCSWFVPLDQCVSSRRAERRLSLTRLFPVEGQRRLFGAPWRPRPRTLDEPPPHPLPLPSFCIWTPLLRW